MIDIMFYLVIFFMIFGTFRTETAGVPLELPRAATAQDLARDHLVITVDGQGRIFYEGRVMTDSDLTRTLLPILRSTPDRVVIIKADRSISYERLVQTSWFRPSTRSEWLVVQDWRWRLREPPGLAVSHHDATEADTASGAGTRRVDQLDHIHCSPCADPLAGAHQH